MANNTQMPAQDPRVSTQNNSIKVKHDEIIIIKLVKYKSEIEDKFMPLSDNYSSKSYRFDSTDSEHLSSYFKDKAFENNDYFCTLVVVYDNNINGSLEQKIQYAYRCFCTLSSKYDYFYLTRVRSVQLNQGLVFRNILALLEFVDFSEFTNSAFTAVEKSRIVADQIALILNEPEQFVAAQVKPTPKIAQQAKALGTTGDVPSANPSKGADGTKKFIDPLDNLHVLAQRDRDCIREYTQEQQTQGTPDLRSEFQRDYDRIVHSKAFRRMVDKAQIFSATKGDYYRTRMTHSQVVTQTARDIATALHLNLFLTEAIALGHDIGHTPFGHQGERTLDDILKGKCDIVKNVNLYDDYYGIKHFGGFKHNFQSLRVASLLEESYSSSYGMNLSYQTLEGMLKHTKLKRDQYDLGQFISENACAYMLPKISEDTEKSKDAAVLEICSTLEGQVVAIADEIAQRGHDLDDALSSNSITYEELRNYLSLNRTANIATIIQEIDQELAEAKDAGHRLYDEVELRNSRLVSKIISYFIHDVIATSRKKWIHTLIKTCFSRDLIESTAH